MNKKKIKQHNDQKFLDDLKSVRVILVLSLQTSAFFHINKNELLREAEEQKIFYYLTDTIFVNKKMAMVII